MKCVQNYATKVFNALKNAEGFKVRLGDRAGNIKTDKLGRFKVRYLIDKSRPKVDKSDNSVSNLEKHWNF